MKRISFFLVILCALILSVGLNSAMAQSGIVDVRAIPQGFFTKDTLLTGSNIRFQIGLNNNIPSTKEDVTLGWQVLSPDGAIWDSVTMDSCGPFSGGESALAGKFPVSYFYGNFYGNSPSGAPDTVGILWSGTGNKPLQQLPIGYNDTAVAVQVWISSAPTVNDGKHLCIDSSFFQPGGTWAWNYGTSTITTVYPTWVATMPGAPAYVDGQGFCYVLYNVPNLPPQVVNTTTTCGSFPPAAFVDPTLSGSHCQAFTYDFNACDKEGDPYTFTMVSGPAGSSIDPNTGVWTGSGLATGNYTVVVHASDAQTGPNVSMSLAVTNSAPVISGACGTTITTSQSSPTPAAFSATDADACDPKIWAIANVVPAGPTVSINGSGLVTFNSPAAGDYVVTVSVSDGIAAPVTCDVTFHVLEGSLNQVVIDKVEDAIQGKFWSVCVTLKALDPALALGGFDFLIAYDNSALSLQGVTPGAIYTDCAWEYFTYRFGANGNCSGGCPSGLVKVIGLAETNNGAHHPTLACQKSLNDGGANLAGEQLFCMNFLVSNNRTYECQYVPIRFFWIDCGDNTLSSYDGSKLILEKSVWDYAGSGSQPYVLDSNLASFPGYAGIPAGVCGENEQLPGGKTPPKRDIDFYDGGIDIVCADSIDARGDINLNGLANEVADAVMFTNYFIKGLNAFGTHIDGSVAASDVNADGITLSVADLVYLIRVIVGDALPYPKTSPVAVTATYSTDNGTVTVDKPMAGAFITVAGNVTPTKLAQNMEMAYSFDGKNTRILVYPPMTGTKVETFTGSFVSVTGNVLSVELATAEGAPVVGKLIPSNYALNQNYPNPFNPTTTISFALPTASQYTLTIYNVTGQSVAEFTGSAEAGEKTIEWNASTNASGVYFYKLVAGNFTSTKKMVLLK